MTCQIHKESEFRRVIRQVAVLGAGVMGSQIAAHMANAGLPVILFELPGEGADKNAHVHKALQGLIRLKPTPLATPSTIHAIQAANYDQHLNQLTRCDLVIEAITERLDWKQDLYKMVVPHLSAQAILATNTSGLSLCQLVEGLPERVQERFCGVHFFNPPRYMHLLELIPHDNVLPAVLDTLEGFFTSALGKGVIRARDTSGFIANRVGIFSMMAVIHHAERLGLTLDLVDKLTGPGIGRPKSATFRTADVVGLDTFVHVVHTLAQTTKGDPWNKYYKVPPWIHGLIEQGALGQKSGVGIYKKKNGEIHVFDPEIQDYRRVRSTLDDEVRRILLEPRVSEKYDALLRCQHPQAEFLKSVFLDLFHFCAFHLEHIAHSARDIDLALRWGYGWAKGPFEIWQAAGWQRVSSRIAEYISGGSAMSDTPLPDWVTDSKRESVHSAAGSWSASESRMRLRSKHPVYRRQPFPELLTGEKSRSSETVFETDAVRLWHTGDGLCVLSFKTKLHTVSSAVLEGTLQAIEHAEKDFKALILWQAEAPFCAGASLNEIRDAAPTQGFDDLRHTVQKFQQTSMALKHSWVPTVAAVQGAALGGGCEFVLHCDRVVAGLESYLGLVEVGVGLVPAGGGCKELALRAAKEAKGDEPFPFLTRFYERVALGKISSSAEQAREWGYLRTADKVVLNPHEILHVAKYEALALFESGYRPPLRRRDIAVAGEPGVATLRARLVNMLKGGFISDHDYEIGSRLAVIMCGGEVDPGSQVSEEWLLQLEVEGFLELLKTDKTQLRIKHMLAQGKPLRN
jgi:3-hydroxyacyl-CoA dehydrogenase